MAHVFVTGATGVLGRGVVEQLVAEGHAVRALARTAERAIAVTALGAEAVVADLYDRAEMTRAVSGTDAVLHLATRIPPVTSARRASAWAENSRLREVGTRVLVDAACAAGVGRVVAESITFVYLDGGSGWLDEQSPADATGAAAAPIAALEQELTRFTDASGGAGVALRFGSFYGPDARSTDEYLRAAKLRVAPVLGAPDGYVSSIHTRDAARAVVAALGAPAGCYNVVDDTPLTRREYADAFARAFGLGRLRIVPPAAALVLGGPAAEVLVRSQRVRNEALRRATGWAPEHPSAVEGWAAVAAEREGSSRVR